jgi:hypothetical protein
VIAVDPHKRSWTATAVDGSLQVQTLIRVEANREGYRELRRFARRWSDSRWAIEGAGGVGAPLAMRLLADGLAVLEVPAKLAARVRALSTGHGRKTDEADAVSVGVAAWTATALVSVRFDETALALRALTGHRDDLVPGGAGVGLRASVGVMIVWPTTTAYRGRGLCRLAGSSRSPNVGSVSRHSLRYLIRAWHHLRAQGLEHPLGRHSSDTGG